MGRSRNFRIIYAGPHKPFKTDQVTTYESGDSPAATVYHWGQVSSCKQSECGRHSLFNILKLQATFLYSIYDQRAGRTNLFHMRGGRFHAGNTLCRPTFKITKDGASLFNMLYMPLYLPHSYNPDLVGY